MNNFIRKPGGVATVISVVALLVVLALAVRLLPDKPSAGPGQCRHGWSVWTNCWKAPATSGFERVCMRQARYCTNCGVINIEEHR